jgi:4'-phosphopantetheinyl transferase
MYREIVPSWVPAPEQPRVADGRVDVWRIPLPAPATAVARPAGRETAGAALRDILGRYLDRPAGVVRLHQRPGGKPFVDAPGPGLEFNLSHCADLALVAVTTGLAVGIDVEAARRVSHPLRMARRMFTADEVALLESLTDEALIECFLDLWTRMEARQKAVGHGIFTEAVDPAGLTSMTFRPGPRHWASLSLSPRCPPPSLRFLDYRPA